MALAESLRMAGMWHWFRWLTTFALISIWLAISILIRGGVVVKQHEPSTVSSTAGVLHPNASGREFTTDSVEEVRNLAFDSYAHHHVVAQVDGRNEDSTKFASQVGMTQAAYFCQGWFSKGEWTDTCGYTVLSTDIT